MIRFSNSPAINRSSKLGARNKMVELGDYLLIGVDGKFDLNETFNSFIM